MLSVFVVCLVFGGLRLSQGAELASGSAEIDGAFFGMHIHSLVRRNDLGRFSAWPEVRFGAWRLHDAYTKWSDLEPAKGQWDFRLLDRYVELAEARGVEVLMTLGSTPRWASARPDEVTYTYGPGIAAEPANLADWENYVRAVVTRYRGRIRAYEIWNEPWFREIDRTTREDGKAAFFSGSAAKMVELAHIAYRTIKQIDPVALVVTPGFDGEESGVRRLELYLKLGGASVTDVVAFHFYVPVPERIPPIARRIREVMARYGLGAHRLWNTELGYFTVNADEPHLEPAGRMLSAETAAAYLMRSLLLSASSGIQRTYWYAWDNGLLGLTDGRGRTINDAGRAYGQAVKWMTGATVRNCGPVGRGIWSCVTSRDGRTAVFAWSTSGVMEWRLTAGASEVETWDGGKIDAGGRDSVKVGPMPILVKTDKRPWGAGN